MFAGKKSAQIREILINESAWEEMTCLFAPSLSKAYALLSMSYVLVWIASMVLPGWEGTFSLKALLGVACIMSGLMLIFLPTTKQRY